MSKFWKLPPPRTEEHKQKVREHTQEVMRRQPASEVHSKEFLRFREYIEPSHEGDISISETMAFHERDTHLSPLYAQTMKSLPLPVEDGFLIVLHEDGKLKFFRYMLEEGDV